MQNLSLKEVSLNIFGPNPADKYGQNISYQGQYSPEDLSNHLNDNFGLVWDGTTPTTCDGIFGNYMKYNNPHKASLYLASGIPVIIWDQAAIAPWIREQKLGITVKSLQEIPGIIDKMSEGEYQELIENVRRTGMHLREGRSLRKITDEIESNER